jgi:hypothetical protein
MKATWLAFVAVSLGVGALPLGAACSSSTNESAPEDTGSVSAAVSTVGPDGAIYSLPSGANLLIARPDNGSVVACRSFLGSGSTVTFSFPAGTYQLALSTTCPASITRADAGPDGGMGGIPFTLNRSADGGASTVAAVLQNPVQLVTVTAGGTTPVVFTFSIQSLGTLTFGTGSASVGIATNPGVSAAPPTTGTIAQSFGPTQYTDTSMGTMPALTALFAMPLTAQYNIMLRSLSPFTADFQDQICATFVASITTAAGTPTTMQALLAGELDGGTGTICFADANATAVGSNMVYIFINRFGPANTPTFQTALSNGADSGAASASFLMGLSAPTGLVYNGSTAALGQFSSPVTLSNATTFVSITSPGGQKYGQLNPTSSASFSISLSP